MAATVSFSKLQTAADDSLETRNAASPPVGTFNNPSDPGVAMGRGDGSGTHNEKSAVCRSFNTHSVCVKVTKVFVQVEASWGGGAGV